jgi:hypothetical protein
MNLAQFFGELSPFQIIISAVALITGIYTFYKNFLERSKIHLYPGDAVRIVVSQDCGASKMHLMCNLINNSTKVGTVHRLEVRVTNSQKVTYEFTWNHFYKYLPGGQQVQKESDIYPVAVFQKDSKLLFIEFQAETENAINWKEGQYKVQVIGWVNRKNRLLSSNLKSTFHIALTKFIIDQLSSPKVTQAIFITVPIIEWERQHK